MTNRKLRMRFRSMTFDDLELL